MPDPKPENEPATSTPSEETKGAAVAPAPIRQRRRARFIPILVLAIGLLAWLGYAYTHKAPAERPPAGTLALEAVGGWWNVIGDRYLELDWEGRRASLWDYSESEEGVESTGTWSATEAVVSVHVSGRAGDLSQQYELVGNDAELFLAPKPISSAKLLDSWISDHGDDDEDSSPKDSMSREASWKPHAHSRHVHLHRRPSKLPT